MINRFIHQAECDDLMREIAAFGKGGEAALQFVYADAPYYGVDVSDMPDKMAIGFRRDLKIILEQLEQEESWDIYDRWVLQGWGARIF